MHERKQKIGIFIYLFILKNSIYLFSVFGSWKPLNVKKGSNKRKR